MKRIPRDLSTPLSKLAAIAGAGLAIGALGGCDEPRSTGRAFNPDSTFHESRQEAPPAPINPPRMSPVRQVLSAYPKDDYEQKVTYMYEIMQAPAATQQVCARWFPDYGRSALDALVAWQRSQETVMTEITDRTHAIWISQADGNTGVVPAVESRFSEDRYQTYLHEFDRTPIAEYKKRCADFPKMLRAAQWDLSRRFRKELAIARQRPVPASIRASLP